MAKTPMRSRYTKPQFNKPSPGKDSRDYPSVPVVKEPDPDFSLLTEEDKDRLRKEAQDEVTARERKRAMNAFLDAEVARHEKELHPEAYEEEKEITIDLALYAVDIVLDGRHYVHGRKYTVKKSVYDALNDIMYRTHKHYRETHRDPMRAMQEAAQAIAKGGPSYATINGSTGLVQRF